MNNVLWQSYKGLTGPAISANLAGWLMNPGSFIQRLKQHGVVHPRVRVLSQSWQFPTLDERVALGMPAPYGF